MRPELSGLLLLLVVNAFPGNFSVPSDSTRDSRIVGGLSAANVVIPFVVSIQLNGKHECGGVIINKRTILTAAQCIDSRCPNQLKVLVGSKTTSISDGQLFSVQALHAHENYTSWNLDYDIGLVRLSRSLTFSSTVQSISLPSPNEKLIDGLYGTVFGWGLLHPGDKEGPNMLHFAMIPVVNQGVCDRLVGNVTEVGHLTDRMLCAGYLSGGIDSCGKDGGGPLRVLNKVVGIVSWGIGCGERNHPGVYSRVSAYVPWIKNVLRSNYNEGI